MKARSVFTGAFQVLICLFLSVFLTQQSWAQNQGFLKETRPLPQPREMHGSAVVGDFLYVLGGAHGSRSVTPSVSMARISDGGQLGSWAETTPLPSPRLYIGNSTLTLGGIIYVVGGSTAILGRENYNNAVYAKPDTNGNLSRWVESVPWPGSGLSTPTAVSTPGYIHLIGGLDSRDRPTDVVLSIKVFDSGHLGNSWEYGSPLPKPLWYAHTAVSFGRVYIWGGLVGYENTTPTSEVFSAPIMSSGRIGQWRREQVSLPVPFYASSISVAGPYLISFSPRESGSNVTNDVYWASATGRGLSTWSHIPTSLPNRVYHAGATDYKRGLVFLTAGRVSKQDTTNVLQRVFCAELSRDARESAYQGTIAMSPAGSEFIDIRHWEREAEQGRAVASMNNSGASPLVAFKSFDEARVSNRPMVLYFHSNRAKSCVDQITQLSGSRFSNITGSAEFALVPVDQDPQFAQQMGVYRVPTWLFFNSRGLEMARHVGEINVDKLVNEVGTIQ